MTSIGPYNMGVEEFRPRRGQSGEERKSVKKNAALLHFLAFLLLDHIFGVLRGEQPLRRGSLPRNSETFSLPFWSQKGRPKNSMLLYRKRDRMVVPLESTYSNSKSPGKSKARSASASATNLRAWFKMAFSKTFRAIRPLPLVAASAACCASYHLISTSRQLSSK